MMYKNMNLPTVTEDKVSDVEKIVRNKDGAPKAAQIRALNNLEVSHGDTSKLLHVSNQHIRNTVKPWREKQGQTYETFSPNKHGAAMTTADVNSLFGIKGTVKVTKKAGTVPAVAVEDLPELS